MITVFYDGKCGLCSREINHYRKIASEGIFDWRDVTEHANDLEKQGVSVADGLQQLHAKDASGQLHVGVDAFILIWRQLRRWRLLGAIVALPIIHQIAHVVYRAFGKWRFKRLTHCQLASTRGA
ncbi:thiol-disulfide oxidoreductase DCC family protein [Thalassospira australica]|uniref:thiol-disulfide oxidoreductase DCC family protein n=1 Tax=Thalassospira australica TaxID=1528106 RepID=UPI000519F30F|nr:DUF393 domain-containing protein [Thalassospira australica]